LRETFGLERVKGAIMCIVNELAEPASQWEAIEDELSRRR